MLHRLAVLTTMLFLAVGVGTAQAQGTAILSGEVKDTYGSVIPAADIIATNNATGVEVTGSTDAVGNYRLTLEPGTYTVTVEASGFEAATASDVEAMAGQTIERDFTLELGAVTTSIVVVGSRAEPRSVTESTVPVDVIRTEDFTSQGSRDLATQLRTVVPSFNINTQPISDAATVVRPANLRNLAPDHTLILVNGKRRHRAAVITWLGNGIADGSQGPDISTIPSIAVRQLEVLRDGAAAQYGSDAIAGVMNFQLKNAPSGGSLEFQTGAYLDSNPGDPATCGSGIIGDIKHSCNGIGGHGQNLSVAGNVGLPMGENGFLNLSMEYGTADPTNRAIQRQRRPRHYRRGQHQFAQHGPGLGISQDQQGPQAVRQLRQIVREQLAILRPHQLRLPQGDRRLLLSESSHPRGSLPRSQAPSCFGYSRVRRRWQPHQLPRPHGRRRTRHSRLRQVRRGCEPPWGKGGPLHCSSATEPGRNREWQRPATASRFPIVNNVPDAAALAAVEADPNCFTLYSRFPGGFTPQFGGDLIDYSLVTGLRGFADNGFTWDASAGIGTSEIDQFIFDTVNASLGYDTPTSFRPGIYKQQEVNFNFDVSYPLHEYLHLAAGTEWRQETFTIGAGGQPSWEIGPYAAQGFSSGSNGFNGYRGDTTAGEWSRSNVAVYGDAEFSDPADKWTIGTALRVEDFEDFGTTVNGKLSGRVEMNDSAALRAAISSGFRAPTPGQQNAFNVTTAFIGGQLTNNGVVPATSGVAVARGGAQLQPEKSINLQCGPGGCRGPLHLHRGLFPDRHRRPRGTVPGDRIGGGRNPSVAGRRHSGGTQLSSVPLLPERLCHHHPGHRPDLDVPGGQNDLQRGLQLHRYGGQGR